MSRILMIGLAGLLLLGCGGDAEEKAEDEAKVEKDGAAEKPAATEGTTKASKPKPAPEKQDTEKYGPRPHTGTLNITQNDLGRVKQLREEQQKRFDEDN